MPNNPKNVPEGILTLDQILDKLIGTFAAMAQDAFVDSPEDVPGLKAAAISIKAIQSKLPTMYVLPADAVMIAEVENAEEAQEAVKAMKASRTTTPYSPGPGLYL